MGDLLFAIANLARKLGIEPESALRKANEKFTKRFSALEETFEARGQSLQDATLERDGRGVGGGEAGSRTAHADTVTRFAIHDDTKTRRHEASSTKSTRLKPSLRTHDS